MVTMRITTDQNHVESLTNVHVTISVRRFFNCICVNANPAFLLRLLRETRQTVNQPSIDERLAHNLLINYLFFFFLKGRNSCGRDDQADEPKRN